VLLLAHPAASSAVAAIAVIPEQIVLRPASFLLVRYAYEPGLADRIGVQSAYVRKFHFVFYSRSWF